MAKTKALNKNLSMNDLSAYGQMTEEALPLFHSPPGPHHPSHARWKWSRRPPSGGGWGVGLGAATSWSMRSTRSHAPSPSCACESGWGRGLSTIHVTVHTTHRWRQSSERRSGSSQGRRNRMRSDSGPQETGRQSCFATRPRRFLPNSRPGQSPACLLSTLCCTLPPVCCHQWVTSHEPRGI